MYIVLNLTNKIIYLSDIKAEIQPNKPLDLENVTSLDNIKKSLDLDLALRTKRLALVHTAKISKNVENKKIENPAPDIKSIIKEVILEYNDQNKNEIKNILKEELSNSNLNIINNKEVKTENKFYSEVDESKLAEISQLAVDKMTNEMEVSETTNNVKINIVNKNLNKLSDEL